ncbi:MAG TPA: hypothetical protein VH415_11645 [Nitrososphaeraceae archaeon]
MDSTRTAQDRLRTENGQYSDAARQAKDRKWTVLGHFPGASRFSVD